MPNSELNENTTELIRLVRERAELNFLRKDPLVNNYERKGIVKALKLVQSEITRLKRVEKKLHQRA